MTGPAMHLARPEVLRMQAYVSARSIAAANDALRLLDANEAPEPFDADGPPIHRYPSQQPERLVERISTGCRPKICSSHGAQMRPSTW